LTKDKDTYTLDTGYLSKARWDITCSIDDPFTRGADTTIIIKLMLQYIHDRYSQVNYISFTDMSTKECDDGSSVNLAAMKLFTDGKTWYETHFDAVIDPRLKDAYDNMKIYADKCKLEMPFDKFLQHTIINTQYISKEALENVYNTSSTWQEFFLNIRNKLGFSKFCIWLGKDNWFDEFISRVLKFNIMMRLHFILTPKQYDIQYTVVKNMSGSGRRRITLKRREHRR
jgi:hypothetical protein